MPENKTTNSNANFESNGKLYEIWLFVLLLIKGYGLPFDIGKEVKIADKFDDVVLRYQNENTSKCNYIFCQVKLVDNGKDKVLDKDVLLGKKQISFNIDDFNLKKYFHSYLKIKEQFQHSDNNLSKLVIYSTVSDLHENLKIVIKDVDKYDQILSAKKTTTRCFIDTNSPDSKHIVRELQNVKTDFNELINILFKYTDEEYASKNPMKNEGIIEYYHKALVDHEILTVYNDNEVTTDNKSSTGKETTTKKKTKTDAFTRCGFHKNFQDGICTISGKHIFEGLYRKSTKLSRDSFRASLNGKKWKVWRTFGENPKENSTSIVQLPTIQSVSERDVLDFLEILEFKVDEPNLNELSQFTKDQFEISKLFGLSDAADYICSKTENYIKRWCKENLQAEGWITDKNNLFDGFKTHIAKIDAQKISYDNIRYYEKLISQYDLHFTNKLTDYIGNPKEKLDTTIIYSDVTFITVLKVVDTLNDFSSQFLCFNADNVIANPNCSEVLSLIKDNENKNIIVLNWERPWPIEKIEEIIEHHKTQLIVITNNSILKLGNWKEDLKIHIDDIERTEKVLEILIDCQGEKVPLKTVLPKDQNFPLKEIVSSEMLKALILGKSNFFYSIDTNKADVTYIPRKFVPSVFNEDIFKRSQSMQNEMFLISGAIDDSTKEQWMRDYPGKIEFSEGDNIDQLENMKNEDESKNIHWLEYKSNMFIWKSTFGSVDFLIGIRENSIENENIYLEERTLIQFSNHLQVITGVAGLGKTFSVNYIKTLYLQEHPNLFAVLVKLNEKQEILSELINQSFEEPEDFVCGLLKEENPFCKQLIKYGIRNQNGTLLLFDEYDQIQSKESRYLFRTHLFKLIGMSNVNIVIMSRPNVVNELETGLNVLSSTLQQFTEENQKSFLEERIAHKVSSKTIEEKSQYIEKILELVWKKINNKEYSLVGIPLILKMMSEVFIDKEIFTRIYLEFHQLTEEFHLIKLYEYFTQTMYRRYFEEKESIPIEKARRLCPKGYETYYYHHEVLSIYSILHQQIDSVNNVFPEIHKQNKTEIENNVCNKGIVTHINGDEVQFIHQTFAEYFFATFIFSNCTKMNYNRKQTEFLLSKVLCDDYFQNVRIFLNSLFSSETNTITNHFNNHKEYLKCSSKLRLRSVQILYHIIYNSVLENNINIFKIFSLFYNDEILLVCKFDNLNNDDYLCTGMLFAAVKNNNIDITKWLFDKGIKKSSVNEFAETALHDASRCGNYELLKTLIKYGLNINQQDNLGRTPLYTAVQNSHIQIVKFLIESGADVNACDKDYVTPLYVAAKNGHIEVVKFLIESGADVNACDKDNWTPIHIAAHNGHFKVVKFLKESGADVNTCDKDYVTPLYVAAKNGHIEVVKFLTENDADVNACNFNDYTPLYAAARIGNIEIVEVLKESGADVNASDTDNMTPLYIATQNGHIEVIKFLKESGADVNISDMDNVAPIHIATQNGHIEIVKFLKESGADVNACDKVNVTPLYMAARNGNIETVEFLIESGADVNACNKNNATPLYIAAVNDHIEVVKFLKESGADVNACNKNNSTPLHVAALNGHIELVKFLKENGADVNARYKDNSTPLHIAARKGHIEVVEFLIESGADLNARNKKNFTPLQIAEINGHIEVRRILEANGIV